MPICEGWAVVAMNGDIYIKTVSDTRRAAIINWLVTVKQCDITRFHTDEDIESMWKGLGQYAECERVIVSRDRRDTAAQRTDRMTSTPASTISGEPK